MESNKLTQTTIRYYYRDYARRNRFLCPTCNCWSAPLEEQVNRRCACGTQNRLVDGMLICVRPAGVEQVELPPLTDEQRAIWRTRSLMSSGKTRSWSHAMMIAGDTLK